MAAVNLNPLYKKAAWATSCLMKPNSIPLVILLESSVIAGRSYQAHKRGGYLESRERICEETTGAVFWIGGVYAYNKLCDKFGKHILGIDYLDYSVGKDEVRKPFEMLLRKNPANRNLLVGFKFGKILLSTIASCLTLGILVPKINQAITKDILKKNPPQINVNPSKTRISLKDIMEKDKKKKDISFASSGALTTFKTMSNMLENNETVRLLSGDVGILAGRVSMARNIYEKIEILFRDIVSLYFYFLAAKNIISLFDKFDSYKGKSTALVSNLAAVTSDYLAGCVKKENCALTPKKFKELAFGNKDINIQLSKFKFDKTGTILLSEFKSIYKDNPMLIKKATLMSHLQPLNLKGRVLTKNQVEDILRGGYLSRAGFLLKFNQLATDGASTDPKKFVSQKFIDKMHTKLHLYTEGIIEYAQKNKIENITSEVIENYLKRNVRKNALNLSAGVIFAVFGLGWLVPKIQYLITEKLTGKKSFPGITQY